MVRLRKRLRFGFNYFLKRLTIDYWLHAGFKAWFLGRLYCDHPELSAETHFLPFYLSFFAPIISPPAGSVPFFKHVHFSRQGEENYDTHMSCLEVPFADFVFQAPRRKHFIDIL